MLVIQAAANLAPSEPIGCSCGLGSHGIAIVAATVLPDLQHSGYATHAHKGPSQSRAPAAVA